MLIDYQANKTYEATLELEDFGNCAIICYSSDTYGSDHLPGNFCLIITTVMGETTLLKWGPFNLDLPGLPSGFDLSVKRFHFKESIIEKELKLFLNNPANNISEAMVIPIDEALSYLPNIDIFKASLE